MPNPLVSVVVPVFNGERFLAEALESVFAQDYRPIEVIVVDDGSTDRSAEIIRSFPEVRLVSQANAGVAAARNAALRIATGEFISFLDQDDRWLPHKLTRQVARLLECPSLGFVTAQERCVLDGLTEAPHWLRNSSTRESTVSFVPGLLVIRRSAMDKAGVFDESLVNGSDTDWVYRAKDLRIAFESMGETLLIRRVHEGNASHRHDISRHEIFEVLRRSIRRQREMRSK